MFVDTAGASRILTEGALIQFLATAYVGPTQRPTLRLELLPCCGGPRAAVVTVRGAAKHQAAAAAEKVAAAASATQWAEDTRDIDELVRSIGCDQWLATATQEASSRQRGKRTGKRTRPAEKRKQERVDVGGGDEVEDEEEGPEAEEEEGQKHAAWNLDGKQDYKDEGSPEEDGKDEGSTEEDSEAHDEKGGHETQDSEEFEEEWESKESESEQQPPMTLWPATPESSPPSSPRFRSHLQPVFWVPVPVWIPAVSGQ